MALVFYLSTNGSDTNSGSSESVIVSGSNATTYGSATVQLPSGTDLSGVNQGDTHDTIRIAGRSDGINSTDVFEITAVDDGNDQVTVTPTPGAGNNQDWCIGGPWHKPQKAMDVVDAGDHVWMKADGDYTDDSDADGICAAIRRAGDADAPIIFEGYKETPGDADDYPGDDDYRATINGTASSLEDGIAVAAGLGGVDLCYLFKNIRVCNCSARGFELTYTSEKQITLKNCRSHSNMVGVYGYESFCEGCCFDNNTIYGVFGYDDMLIWNCDIFNNGDCGIMMGGAVAVMNRVYGNGGHGINTSFSGHPQFILNNTLDGDGKPSGKVGIYVHKESGGVVANNIIHDFDIGAKATGGNPGQRLIARNNLFTDNNTDRDDFPEGPGDVSADDPGFVDEANNDYRLRFTSPARGAGNPAWIDIGASQRKEMLTHSPTNVGVQI